MRNLSVLLLAALALNTASCAYKNDLRTPSQIKTDEAKKAREEAKRAAGERSDQPLLPAFAPKDERAVPQETPQ